MSQTPSNERQFLAVIVPYKAAEVAPLILPSEASDRVVSVDFRGRIIKLSFDVTVPADLVIDTEAIASSIVE
jgi:hypothetical protein